MLMYKSFNEHILKYRREHPRCRYCEFYKHICPPAGNCQGYNKCVLKDKPLTD